MVIFNPHPMNPPVNQRKYQNVNAQQHFDLTTFSAPFFPVRHMECVCKQCFGTLNLNVASIFILYVAKLITFGELHTTR